MGVRRARGSAARAAGVVVAVVLAVVLAFGAAGCDSATDRAAGPSSSATAGSGSTAPALGDHSAPTRPEARVCGSEGLRGPSTAPGGARRVTPADRLDRVAAGSPPGTTFWLTPGVHRLGPGAYASVQPKDGQTFTGGPGAVLDGRHVNRYAFTGRATGVTIEHLTIQHFGKPRENNNEGVVNHDAGHHWVVRHNTVQRNAGAGVFIGSGDVVTDNCLLDNGQYGFSAYEARGVRDVVLAGNEVAGNNTDDWERLRPGCGCTGGGKFWQTSGARVTGNWIHDNHSVGLWADTNNTDFLIQDNYISDNGSGGVIYETSYNAAIIDNTFARNGLVEGPDEPGFPTPALYISESGSDPRAGAAHGRTFEIAGNRFVDNWSAVVAWENADRFAGSPANTSTGVTTLVNPGTATVRACSDPDLVGRRPYVDDCRWKTQHLRVEHNLFRFTPSHLGPECKPSTQCGYMALVSNYGTYPAWSPYKRQAVEDDITLHQDNVWRANRYVGPWRFQVRELGNTVSWQTWRGRPYGQDRSSTLD